MPHSKFLSQVFQVRFWCCKKQIWSTHRVDWEDDLKIEDNLNNEDDQKMKTTKKWRRPKKLRQPKQWRRPKLNATIVEVRQSSHLEPTWPPYYAQLLTMNVYLTLMQATADFLCVGWLSWCAKSFSCKLQLLLSNSSLSLVRLGVDFVLPLSQEEQQDQEQKPSSKSARRKCTTDLKFGTET